jgi:hypothetical protein
MAVAAVVCGLAVPAAATSCPELSVEDADASDYVFTGKSILAIPTPVGDFVLFRATRHWSSSTAPFLLVASPKGLFENGIGYLVFARAGAMFPTTSKCYPNAELPLRVARAGGHEPEFTNYLVTAAALGVVGLAVAGWHLQRRRSRLHHGSP